MKCFKQWKKKSCINLTPVLPLLGHHHHHHTCWIGLTYLLNINTGHTLALWRVGRENCQPALIPSRVSMVVVIASCCQPDAVDINIWFTNFLFSLKPMHNLLPPQSEYYIIYFEMKTSSDMDNNIWHNYLIRDISLSQWIILGCERVSIVLTFIDFFLAHILSFKDKNK